MAIFSKLNQIREMRKKAKEMQGQLAQEEITGKAWDDQVQITMDGSQKVKKVTIADAALTDKTHLEKAIAEALADASKQLQKIMVRKVRSGEMEMPKF